MCLQMYKMLGHSQCLTLHHFCLLYNGFSDLGLVSALVSLTSLMFARDLEISAWNLSSVITLLCTVVIVHLILYSCQSTSHNKYLTTTSTPNSKERRLLRCPRETRICILIGLLCIYLLFTQLPTDFRHNSHPLAQINSWFSSCIQNVVAKAIITPHSALQTDVISPISQSFSLWDVHYLTLAAGGARRYSVDLFDYRRCCLRSWHQE